MCVIVINGKFMADRMQGIVRYGREIVQAIDRLSDKSSRFILAVPPNASDIPKLNEVEVLRIGKAKGLLWEQVELVLYMRKHKDYVLLNLCNVTPLFIRPGITTIHDVTYKAFPNSYKSIRNKLSRLWHCFQYKYIERHEKVILTVSNYAKEEIIKYYPNTKGKIHVVGNGWQHTLRYSADKTWNIKFPYLESKKYYFSLSTFTDFKNIKWIIEVAKRNLSDTFVIAGTQYDTKLSEVPPNVKLIGFVNDQERTALMQNCKAFLFPSIYESFGIPTLEALSNGAKVLSSNSACQPEILGNCAAYFDPYDYEVDLNELLSQNLDDPWVALEKHSWDKATTRLLKVIYSINK